MTDDVVVLVRGRIVLQSSSRRLLDEPEALEEALTVQQRVESRR
jgi:ABC-type branched-subunit amino acid transport system ATPase component